MSWSLDANHTQVNFSTRHLGLSTVRGTFAEFRVDDITFDPADVTRSRGTVSVAVLSLTTGDAKRDGHLKSPDFFDVEHYPEITFAITDVVADGGGYKVHGDLTIHGVAKPVVLDGEYSGVVNDPFGNTKAGFALSGTINRKDWGMGWNAVLEGGGLLVSEKVKLEIEFQLAEVKVPVGAAV